MTCMSNEVETYKSHPFDLTHKLTVQKHGHTALITINNPPANTWDRDSLIGLKQLIEHLNRDDDVYALVITGQGHKFFSAGADLKLFADADKARAREMARRFGEAFTALRDFRGVSIAAINGYAMGGGLECALACDIRIAEQHAQLALPEATVGLLPCAGGTQALPWLVGEGWAKRMILCGERVDAETALRIGLIEQVVDSGESRGHALLLAAKVAKQSPVAIRTIKPLIQGARERAPNSWLAAEREGFVDLFDADDTREGVNAFLEKRDPHWRNC
jgi:enoyl-CoA hydratase/carnithine racemase